MIDFVLDYKPLVEVILIHAGFALSQYIVLRAGVFSIATAGFAAIGAYSAAILSVTYGVPPALSVLIATITGALLGILIAVPLARLRGVYQAIATLAFVQVVLSANIYFDGITGGPNGFNGIPKVVEFWTLLIALAGVLYVLASFNASRAGRAATAIQQDEAMAASLGVSVIGLQTTAFALSGAIAGLFGALEAFHGYALDPTQFDFVFAISVLSYVVLGGRRSLAGPVIGAAVLVLLPELARPLEDFRMLIFGAVLIAVIIYLPKGIADTTLDHLRSRAASVGSTGRVKRTEADVAS